MLCGSGAVAAYSFPKTGANGFKVQGAEFMVRFGVWDLKPMGFRLESLGFLVRQELEEEV